MAYTEQNFEQLVGTAGFSEQLLRNHFKLYGGYVANTNKLMETMKTLVDSDKMATPEFAELKRRFGWEFNGMRLHEYYFENMTCEARMSDTNNTLDPDSPLARKIASEFGSHELWEKDFMAIAAMRGIGWAILAYDRVGERLFNVWINEHDVGFLAGASPLLVMDVFEHAYMLDYGVKRTDYVTAFMKVIDWEAVKKRF